MLTETQRKWLTEYIEKPYHEFESMTNLGAKCSCGSICGNFAEHVAINPTFTDPKDKQDLLEAINKHGEWIEFEIQAMFLCPLKQKDFTKWLLLLSPLETAELICKWKGVKE